MTLLYCLALLGIIYTYAGYPIAMWVLSRTRRRPWRIAPVYPDVSVVLAVHNGAALLPRKIDHLVSLDYPNICEIIIVSDGSTDGTAELLAAQQHPLIKPIILKEHSGKAAAVNAGMAASTADVILFVDIRPEIAPGALKRLVSNFADPAVGCVAGELIVRRRPGDAASAAIGGLYWRYEQWIRKCESAFDSPVGVYGGFYAVRRHLASQQPNGMILDDMFQPLSIIRQGYRSVLDSHAHVYDAWPDKAGAEFHRKVRTLAGNFQLFWLAPWTLTTENRLLFQLVSHKCMRLLAPYLMALLLAISLSLSLRSFTFAILSAVQMTALLLATAGLRFKVPILHRLAAPASALLVLNAAAVVGLYKFLATPEPLWKIWHSTKQDSPIRSHAAEDMLHP